MTENQAYSLVSRLSTTGNVDAVVMFVRMTFPEHVTDARKFLTLYTKYCKGKLNKPGNGYVDVAAFKKACMMFAKAEDSMGESRD